MIRKNIYYILLLETVDNEIQLIFEAIYSQILDERKTDQL